MEKYELAENMNPIIETINQNKPNYISNSLIHWTGNNKTDKEALNTLNLILESSALRFCKNRINYERKNEHKNISDIIFETQMICFTDIPIEHSFSHCTRYGFMGISFEKEKLIKYGANPVLYYLKNRKNEIDFFDDTNPVGSDETGNISLIRAMFQMYDSGHSEYYEREWRINRILPSSSHCEENNKNLFEIDQKRFKGKVFLKDEYYYMEFDKKIINAIVVKNDFRNEATQLMEKHKLNCKLILIN